MAQTLKNKTAVVTGSTSGIGFEIAKEMLARGANVMFHGVFLGPKAAENRAAFDRDFGALKAQYPNQKLALNESDIGDYDAVKKLIDETATLGGGKIDALVNNAGVQIQKPIAELSAKEFDLVIKTNMYGYFFTTKTALEYMKRAAGEGFTQIVNISSVHGLVPSPERVVYCMAKHGDEALKGVAAAEFAPFHIRVNNINPAFVKTPLAEGPINDRAKANVAKGMSEADAKKEAEQWRLGNQGGKWIAIEQVAETVADLADFTDKRNTGESILLDNGYVDLANKSPDGAAWFDKEGPKAVDAFNALIAGNKKAKSA